jgi:sulfur relay (sulfurtransferase) complex TusBCD TusD component (DsrE family)
MKMLFVVRTDPYAFEHMHTVVALSKAALAKGHEVNLFLTEDAVVTMNANARTGQNVNFTSKLAELQDQGVKVQACGACCQFRGLQRSDIHEGFKMAGVATLGKMINEADRVMSFGY